MSFKSLSFCVGLSLVSGFAHAHPSKCQHTHNGRGGITWEENCGGNSHLPQSPTKGTEDEKSPHAAHLSKHNLVLFGQDEIFASHIVFKKPHNFQLILKVNLDDIAKRHYAQLKSINPEAQIVFLLDPMDLSSITQVTELSGVMKERGTPSKITPLQLKLSKNDFEIVYFEELPLDLNE